MNIYTWCATSDKFSSQFGLCRVTQDTCTSLLPQHWSESKTCMLISLLSQRTTVCISATEQATGINYHALKIKQCTIAALLESEQRERMSMLVEWVTDWLRGTLNNKNQPHNISLRKTPHPHADDVFHSNRLWDIQP